MQLRMNKLVCISGCSRGLGRALAVEFSARGWHVAGAARTSEALDQLKQSLGTDHYLQTVDVTNPAQVDTFSSKVIEKLGCPDLLVNNAAVINRNRFLWDLGAAEFDEVIDINIKGVANVIRHFFKPMAKAGRGVIVNFSSGWGRSTSPEVAPYCATKWAIEGLTQSLAQELPEGMATVPLNPGVINTDMLRSCFGPSAADFPSTEEWAEMAVPFLLELGPGHNGQSLTVS